MKILICAAVCALILAGCHPAFLKQEEIDRLSISSSTESRIVYYQKLFRFAGNGELSIRTHMLIRAGENIKAHPGVLYVFDTPSEKLERYDARITSPGGKTRRYSQGDLNTLNTSGRRRISDTEIKYLPIDGKFASGDLIEVVYEHTSSLSSFGASFSLNELLLDANNISCEIEFPAKDSLLYAVMNDKDASTAVTSGERRTVTFHWNDYTHETGGYELGTIDTAPGVIVCVLSRSPEGGTGSWSRFGAWYLDLIREKLNADDAIHALAVEIVKGKTAPKEKLDAIFEYCQHSIRYEQVYFDRGEVIPHSCAEILKNKYGDCKDYSTAICALAKSIGIDAHLALTHRGRGTEFKENVPASQFNHMIVHYRENGTDYWYDGTNRTGLPGVVSNDLINQRALVLGADSSYLATIRESEQNLLSIAGTLTPVRNGFSADLQIGMKNQFAIDFFYVASELNTQRMQEYFHNFLKETLHHSMIIEKMTWSKSDSVFTIAVRCQIPNSSVAVGTAHYSSLGKLFPDLFPATLKVRRDETFYFPYYNRVAIDLKIDGAERDSSDAAPVNRGRWSYRYEIDPGPFSGEQREAFFTQFASIAKEFNSNIKLNY